jgi:putative oxidoreductase
MQALLPFLGRVLIGAIFLWSAITKIRGFETTSDMMSSKGIFAPQLLLLGAIVLMLLGSIAVILGIKARWGAIFLIIFLIPTTILFHPPNGSEEDLIDFMKNLAVIGGLLMIVSFGPGALSFEGPSPSLKK